MSQCLRRVAGSLGVAHQTPHPVGCRRAGNGQGDGDLLEIWGRVVDIVFLRVLKGASDVRRCIIDRDLVQGREPRQLREQSKGRPNHEVLEWACCPFGPATRQRFVGLDNELSHPALEVHVFQDSGHGPGGDLALLSRLRSQFLAQAFDFRHLLLKVHPTPVAASWLPPPLTHSNTSLSPRLCAHELA